MVLKSGADLNIEASQGLTIKAGAKLSLKGQQGGELDGGSQLDVKASGQVKVTGAMVDVNSGALQVM